MHGLIPREAMRVLDVGCNDGGFGVWLQADVLGREVYGVEPNTRQADIARGSLTGVVTAPYPDALEALKGNFDCITFNHVLEHMVDPWSALERTRERLTGGGSVVAVIPNIRYFTVLLDLAVRGRWNYQDAGVLDRTHLRFFTKSSVEQLFESAGMKIDSIAPVNGYASISHPRVSSVMKLFLGDLICSAYAIRAHSASR